MNARYDLTHEHDGELQKLPWVEARAMLIGIFAGAIGAGSLTFFLFLIVSSALNMPDRMFIIGSAAGGAAFLGAITGPLFALAWSRRRMYPRLNA